MMTFALSVISDRLQALTRALDADPSAPGKLMIYSGDRPATGGAPEGTLLVTCVFLRPSLDNVTAATLTLRNPLPAMAVSTGIAKWARLTDGAGRFVADLDVGTDADTDVEVIIRKEDGSPAETTNMYAGGEFAVLLARLVDA